ncbi:glycosyltransferase [Phycicoccus sp. Root563]|uniref:glycosyltransferase n=1 Tax=Phycicoccus sp. Root563 TaxID=1736562 RepID=UPI0009EBE971|nr:glycosyltransferase [Phycicoccus sp. Root563]
MTLAPPHRMTEVDAGQAVAVSTVTAVLVLRGPASALPQTLDSLARQSRRPDRLVVVDPGVDGGIVEAVRSHAELAAAIPDTTFVTVPASSSVARAVHVALAAQAPPEATPDAGSHAESHIGSGTGSEADSLAVQESSSTEHLWVLTCDSAAAPMTLARLLDAVRRSPSVGIAGPKLLDWTVPGALRSVGLQLTRSGRIIPSPVVGEPDQGQYDRRTDVLAVPATGMLVERGLYERLAGPDRAFGGFGADIDFSWRAHQSGRRVVVVPRATLRTGAPDRVAADDGVAAGVDAHGLTEGIFGAPLLLGDESVAATDADAQRGTPGPASAADSPNRQRRQARRVALARCAWWALPLLTVWIAVSSLVAALALLVAKRPRAAWAELSDLGAVLTPWRVLGARWRSRGTRTVRRRDLKGLFVTQSTVLRHTGDLVHDQVAFDDGRLVPTASELVEPGPVADEVQDLNILGSTWASRFARNPGLLAVLLVTVTSLAATRSMGGSVVDRLSQGVVGGELLGGRATAGATWHAWLDGWHGAGLGSSGEQGPHLVVLAALAWLVTHVPVLGAPDSPLGSAVAVLVTLAMPLATFTAYLAGRVVNRSAWPRGLAALAWGSTAVLTTAVAAGRLGAVVAAVLLPLVVAGFVLAARRGGSATVTAATVLATAVLGAFVPAYLPLAALVAVLVVVFGHGLARLRGLALLVGPVVLLGPWVQTLVDQPHLFLTGPGLSIWGAGQALPWQLALLHPGGPASYPVLVSAPIVLAGVLGLVRGGAGRGWAATALAALGLVGLAYAVLAPRLVLGTVPAGDPGAGRVVTAWSGTGLSLLALALLAAALLGTQGLAVRHSTGGWVALLRWPIAALVIVAVVSAVGWTTWHTLGDTLGTWTDPRPAVAIDQAESGIGNRMLLLEPETSGLAYSLLGREPGAVARVLPATSQGRPDPAALTGAVSHLFETGAGPDELDPSRDLSDLAVGFVGLRTDGNDPRVRVLDGTAGLSRLGEHDGVLFWRVLPGGGDARDDAVAPSRVRIVTAGAEQALPLDGDHGRLVARAVVPPKATLVLAEPTEWFRHARVSVDGDAVAPKGDTAAYPLPAGSHTIAVQVLPASPLWRWAQGAALLLVVFLAIPFGTRASRRRK